VNETTEITGSISITGSLADDLYNRQFAFYNLQINGSITDTYTKQHTLIIKNCQLYSTNRAVYVNSTSATDQRTFISECKITQSGSVGADPSIQINKGWLDIETTYVARTSNATLLFINGDAKLVRCAYTQFESSTSSANAVAINIINSTQGTPQASYGYSSFVYSNSTPKTLSTSSAVYLQGAGNGAVFLQNSLALAGVSHTNPTITYAIYGGAGTFVSQAGNYALPGTGYKIGGGITHTGAVLPNTLS
jgi:hypothetical protein